MRVSEGEKLLLGGGRYSGGDGFQQTIVQNVVCQALPPSLLFELISAGPS